MKAAPGAAFGSDRFALTNRASGRCGEEWNAPNLAEMARDASEACG